jgi:hypothetical protein
MKYKIAITSLHHNFKTTYIMKTKMKLMPFILFGLCLVFNSCSEDNLNTENTLSTTTKNFQFNYLSDFEASIIAEQMLTSLEVYSDQLTEPNVDVNHEVSNYYTLNENILNNFTEYTDIEQILVNNVASQNHILNEDDILNAEHLSEKQKEYALNLFQFASDNDLEGLIDLKNQYFIDVLTNPELQVYSLIFALIDKSEEIILQKGKDCRKEALRSAILDGVIGMVGGVIVGGLSGFTIGGFLSLGVLALPAGGVGALGGAIIGGLAGFAEGYLRAYLSCKFWS